MDTGETDKITIALYKGHRRYKVLTMPLRTLISLITINAFIIVACVIFFTAFIFQWTAKWRVIETNNALKKEIQLLKK